MLDNRPTYLSNLQMSFDSSEIAEIGLHDGLWTAPNKEEQSFSGPTARRVSNDEAGSLGGLKCGLGGPEYQCIRLSPKLARRAAVLASHELPQQALLNL